jgi:F-type H+-transporting ATPase subunit b
MLKRIVLMLAAAAWLATPAPAPAQDHAAAPSQGDVETSKGHAATDAQREASRKQQLADQAAEEAARGGHTGVVDAHGAAADHGAAGGHDAHDKAPLLPDPTSRETVLQSLWVIIIFVALLAILYPTAWKNVLAGLKSREERIRRDIADAEAARAKAEATLRDYNQQLATAEGKIRDMLAKAQADGERIATNLRMQAQTESEEIKNRANREIEAAKEQAVAEVHQQMAVLATSVAEKIIRRNLNADDQRDLVSRSLEQVGSISKN